MGFGLASIDGPLIVAILLVVGAWGCWLRLACCPRSFFGLRLFFVDILILSIEGDVRWCIFVCVHLDTA